MLLIGTDEDRVSQSCPNAQLPQAQLRAE